MLLNLRFAAQKILLSNSRHVSNTANKVETRHINKILIANRGEIACRIVRTAKRCGIRTVAVYSEADRNSLHTKVADEAYCIGPAASQKSYLRGEKILEVAKSVGAQAVHPGYGFLSENVEFAELCQKERVIFMGPPAKAIRDMGIKSTSKAIMAAAGVPIVPGYHGDDQSDERLMAEADKIGFPLMIKAVRGGGGKGMRIAETREDFISALNSARTESEKAFNDTNMLLERYVRSPRHVEVQIFADMHGNAVYLFERDCSVQRRHQKIIEEAPAPGLSDELRKELGEAAVRAAKAVGYVGAGTVEFILDKEDLSFHFMEMNTRLQVEHPITEMITGTDLVEWQIKIASGEPLPLTQDQITRQGHAFEARIYAESPRGRFLPGAGPLEHLSTPTPNAQVRVETGVRQGDEVSIFYDPMIAKLVVWGENRTQALDCLIQKLADYHITGLDTNINFLLDLAKHPSFQSGDVHTGFIDQHFDTLFPPEVISETTVTQAATALFLNELYATSKHSESRQNPFYIENNFRMNFDAIRTFKLKFNDKIFVAKIKISNASYEISINEGPFKPISVSRDTHLERFSVRLGIDGDICSYSSVITPNNVTIFDHAGQTKFEIVKPKFLEADGDLSAGGAASKVTAPMPGLLDKLLVKVGDEVKKGDPVAVIIAMKMEHVLKAPRDGKVKSVAGSTGINVAKNQAVVTFEEEETKE